MVARQYDLPVIIKRGFIFHFVKLSRKLNEVKFILDWQRKTWELFNLIFENIDLLTRQIRKRTIWTAKILWQNCCTVVSMSKLRINWEESNKTTCLWHALIICSFMYKYKILRSWIITSTSKQWNTRCISLETKFDGLMNRLWDGIVQDLLINTVQVQYYSMLIIQM